MLFIYLLQIYLTYPHYYLASMFKKIIKLFTKMLKMSSLSQCLMIFIMAMSWAQCAVIGIGLVPSANVIQNVHDTPTVSVIPSVILCPVTLNCYTDNLTKYENPTYLPSLVSVHQSTSCFTSQISEKITSIHSSEFVLSSCQAAHPSFLFELYARIFLNMCVLLSEYHCTSSIANKCMYIKLKLQQNLFRKHDFRAYLKYITKQPILANGAILLFFLVLHHFLAFQMTAHYICNKTSKLHDIFKSENIPCSADIDIECIGGGKASIFSFYELMPASTNNNASMDAAKYKFHSYMPKSEALSLDSSAEKSLVIVNHPFELLIPKLTIANLKVIAAHHGILVHSKMNQASIQTAIQNHVCSNCAEFVSIFEFIDEAAIAIHKKTSSTRAVNKFKPQLPDKYA
jgi:hypothetical protein